MSYIYILTNKSIPDYIKIGITENVEETRKKLSTKVLPCGYDVYATYETPARINEKEFVDLLGKINSEVYKVSGNGFLAMDPETGFALLEGIAKISGTEEKLMRNIQIPEEETGEDPVAKEPRKTPINFYECGLKNGDELVFADNLDVVVTVCGAKKVMYNGEETSLSKVAAEIRGVRSVRGPDVFSYNGETLTKLAERTQWKQKEEAVM